MDYNSVMAVAIYPQYSLAIILVAVMMLRKTKIMNSDLIPYVIMILLCAVSFANGVRHDYSVNIKPFIITFLFLFLNTRKMSFRLFEKMVVAVTILLLLEYAIAYTQVIQFEHITRFSNYLIRPMGALFFDMHLLSYYVVFSYFAIGYTKLSGVFSLIFASFQTALAWFVLAFQKINKILLLFFIIVLTMMLYYIGHLDFTKHGNSMLSVILQALEAPVKYDCLILGCSVNITDIPEFSDASALQRSARGTSASNVVTDFGYYRVGYQFGLLWIGVLLFMLRKYNKFAILANVVLWVHYPISLGVLGFIMFVWILQYMKYGNSTKVIDKYRFETP